MNEQHLFNKHKHTHTDNVLNQTYVTPHISIVLPKCEYISDPGVIDPNGLPVSSGFHKVWAEFQRVGKGTGVTSFDIGILFVVDSMFNLTD